MDCPDCSTPMVTFPVPEDMQSYFPGEQQGAGICQCCLKLRPLADPPDEAGDFGLIDESFPADRDAAIPMAMVVGLLSSLATYREEIAGLLAHVERAGVDPLLVIDRLSYAEGVETQIDLQGRRRHLEQLL